MTEQDKGPKTLDARTFAGEITPMSDEVVKEKMAAKLSQGTLPSSIFRESEVARLERETEKAIQRGLDSIK